MRESGVSVRKFKGAAPAANLFVEADDRIEKDADGLKAHAILHINTHVSIEPQQIVVGGAVNHNRWWWSVYESDRR